MKLLNFIKNKYLKKGFKKRAGLALPGFSMIEVITVLLVISIGMGGTISLVTQSIQGQMINKNTLIAYQLAQEGVELVRFVRDTNWKNDETWDTGIEPGRYYMDYSMADPILISPSVIGEGVGKLVLDSNGFYISEPSTYLPEGYFSRIINISKVAPESPNMLVEVEMVWFDRGTSYSYVLEAELYDWF